MSQKIGTIYTGPIFNNTFDVNTKNRWLITATTANKNINMLNMIHVKTLAPKSKTFQFYLTKRKQGNWNEISFQEYTRMYIDDIKHDPNAIDTINQIVMKLKQGEDVYLFCFCENKNLCHRTILAQEFQNAGYTVINQ